MALKKPPRRSRQVSLGNVSAASKRADEKRAASRTRWLSLSDGDQIVVRVLDVGTDFKDGYVHRTPVVFTDDSGKSRKIDVDVMCLDQDEEGIPCPGCKDNLDRRYKFWTNVIVRDWEDPETGETKDTLMIWSGGITIARKLGKMDAKHGLRNRDIEIEREGSTFNNTKYDVDWADDENTPLSANDKKLEKGKYDLTRYVTIPDFDDFYKPPGERNRDNDDDAGQKSLRRNVLRQERNSDDDDDRPRPRRVAKKQTKTNPLSPRSNGSSTSKPVVRRRSR